MTHMTHVCEGTPGWKKFSEMNDYFHSDGTPLHTFLGLEDDLRRGGGF